MTVSSSRKQMAEEMPTRHQFLPSALGELRSNHPGGAHHRVARYGRVTQLLDAPLCHILGQVSAQYVKLEIENLQPSATSRLKTGGNHTAPEP